MLHANLIVCICDTLWPRLCKNRLVKALHRLIKSFLLAYYLLLKLHVGSIFEMDI
jgi:hypothetical protein